MHCVNHPDTDVQSFCQNCGKPLCSACVRKTAAGQILCESCMKATGGVPTDPGQTYWQGTPNVPPGQIPPFYGIPLHGANPSAAAVLGIIPGVGAMYNGQFFKALIHVVIFVVLVSITQRYGVFGIFIGAWVLYQSFEAFHTAKARRDGQPLPDPFGLNELGSWLNLGISGRGQQPPNPNQPPPPASGYAQTEPPPYSAPYTSSWSGYGANPTPGAAGPIPPQPQYTEPYAGPNPGPYPYPENYPPGSIPPIPPTPPYNWRRKEPIFAFVLIGFGVIFLLQSLGVVSHLLHYIWPLMLIGMGAWLIVRRIGYTQGGPK
jgi:B-box zinc finger